MRMFIKKMIPLIMTAVLLLHPSAASVEAAGAQTALVNTQDELIEWYKAGVEGASLSSEIRVDKPILFDGDKNKVIVNASSIRIVEGGSLTVNNPNFVLLAMIVGVTAVIVEDGGKLILQSGTIAGGANDVIVSVKSGGELQKQDDFVMTGVVEEENDNSVLPPDDSIKIVEKYEETFHLTSILDEPFSEEQCRAMALFNIEKEPFLIELPVTWDMSKVDINQEGLYHTQGQISEETLKANNLSNPYGYMASLTVDVRKKGPLGDVKGEFSTIDSQGEAITKLILPILPPEVTALYLEKSRDGVHWEKASAKDYLADVKEATVNSYCVLTYKFISDYKPIWLRCEIVGSAFQGVTNPVMLTLPEGSAPGVGGENDDLIEDGSSGGNRGGAQGETERTGMVEQPVESAPVVPVEKKPASSKPQSKPTSAPDKMQSTSSAPAMQGQVSSDNSVSSEQETSSKQEQSAESAQSSAILEEVSAKPKPEDPQKSDSGNGITVLFLTTAGLATAFGIMSYLIKKRKF